jgi:carbon monoxide dehydrogenase subunit G
VPRQTFMHRVLVKAEPARVWEGLQRPDSWGRIGGVSSVDQPTFDALGDLTGYRFTVEFRGNSHFGVAKRSQETPGRRVSMTIDTDLLGGEIDVELEPSGEETAVTVAMTVQSKSFMTSMLFPVITGAISSGFSDEAERFAQGLAEAPTFPDEHLPEGGQPTEG